MPGEQQKPNPPPAATHRARRQSSSISFQTDQGRGVYVKEYWDAGRGDIPEIIRQRTAREADVIQRVIGSQLFQEGLGTLKLMSAEPASARVVTEMVPGQSLDRLLRGAFHRDVNSECLSALFLAGRWLSRFQELPRRAGDEVRFSDNDPSDLVAYCRLRMQALAERRDAWATPATIQQAEQRLAGLMSQAGPRELSHVWCHGDYNPENLIWDGKTLTAIDFAMSKLDQPLVDVAGFVHRLEMLPVFYPWKRWPLAIWKQAFLWGYGWLGCERLPAFRAVTIRHLLCRLLSYHRRSKNPLDRLQNAWVRRTMRIRLTKAISE